MFPQYEIVFGNIEYFDSKQLYLKWHIIRLKSEDDQVRFKLLGLPSIHNCIFLMINFQMGTGVLVEELHIAEKQAFHGDFTIYSFEEIWNNPIYISNDKRYAESESFMESKIWL